MLHCNGIDPFVTLMGNFNWGSISRKDIVSKYNLENPTLSGPLFFIVNCYTTPDPVPLLREELQTGPKPPNLGL